MAVEGFSFSVPQEVTLRDLDGFGHVNNAVYLTYVENARVAYLAEVVGARTPLQIRNIMASVTVEFRAQISYGDELEIGVRTERIGTKSFQLAYRIVRQGGEVAAEVTSAQVMFDFEANRAIEVPPEWRRAIAKYEGKEHLEKEAK
jgi:acyl-CoA thioester hydrolase